MIRDLKRYPTYKDSGVSWLGEVPKHWEILPALAAYKPRQVKNTGMVENTVLSLSYGRIIVKPEEKLRGLVPESFETYQIVDPGNIIVRTTDLQNDHTSLRIGHSRYRGIITSAYMCLDTTPRVSNEYGYQFLNTYDLLKIIYGYGSGLRQNLDFGEIKRMPVLVPPHDEQSSIVRFLEYAEGRIRRYIRAKQKMIKLLEEQKQAIINHAVTKGLDPNVRLKPSGIEWLGDIPEHWEVRPLKQLLSRMDYGTSSNLGKEGRIKVLTMGHIQNGEVAVPEHGNLDTVPAGLILGHHDLLFNRTNSPELVGKVGIFRGTVEDNISFASYLVRLRTNPENSPEWLNALLNSCGFWSYARSQALVSLHQANLNSTRYGQMLLPVPPKLEQRKIADVLRQETSVLAMATESASREIALLREYRTRLIADVVTGKLDVREAAANLPEEIQDPEEVTEEEMDTSEDEPDSEETDE